MPRFVPSPKDTRRGVIMSLILRQFANEEVPPSAPPTCWVERLGSSHGTDRVAQGYAGRHRRATGTTSLL